MDFGYKAIKLLEEHKFNWSHLNFVMDNIIHKSASSYNNLASYLYIYGNGSMEKRYIKEKIQYLYKKALRLKDNEVSNYMLGSFYYDLESYKKSYHYYKKAYEFSKSLEILINLCIVLISLKEYKSAISILTRILQKKGKSHDAKVKRLLLYCLCETNENCLAKQLFVESKNIFEESDIIVIHFAYKYGDYQYVVDNYKKYLKEWIFGEDEFKIIISAMLHLKLQEEARKFYLVLKNDIEDKKFQDRISNIFREMIKNPHCNISVDLSGMLESELIGFEEFLI